MIEQTSILVKAYFAPVGKKMTVKVPTGEKKKGIFGGEKDVFKKEKKWQQTGLSDCVIDSERLNHDLQKVVERLNRENYRVVSITSVISGDYAYRYQAQGIDSSKRILSETEKVSGGASFGYGYGFSFTDSLIVLAEKCV